MRVEELGDSLGAPFRHRRWNDDSVVAEESLEIQRVYHSGRNSMAILASSSIS